MSTRRGDGATRLMSGERQNWPADVDPERSIIPPEDYARIIAMMRADRKAILPAGAENPCDGTVEPGEEEF